MCDKQEQFVTQTLLTNLKQFVKVLMANKILILNALRMIIQVKIDFGLQCVEKWMMEKIIYNHLALVKQQAVGIQIGPCSNLLKIGTKLF